MVLILSLAASAIALIRSFNRLKARNPERLDQVVGGVQQSTGVVLALANGCQSVINALIGIRAAVAGTGWTGQPLRGGGITRPANTVMGEA